MDVCGKLLETSCANFCSSLEAFHTMCNPFETCCEMLQASTNYQNLRSLWISCRSLPQPGTRSRTGLSQYLVQAFGKLLFVSGSVHQQSASSFLSTFGEPQSSLDTLDVVCMFFKPCNSSRSMPLYKHPVRLSSTLMLALQGQRAHCEALSRPNTTCPIRC